jgi:hypothetical protein
MWDLWRIAIGAGLQDGFNPCTLMTCAVFMLHGIWLSQYEPRLARLRILFVLTYIPGLLYFNFGPIGTTLFHKPFVLTAKIAYFVLGAASFILGSWFLKSWFLAHRGHGEDLTSQKTKSPVSIILLCLLTVFLSGLLSMLATLWPINYYMALLGTGGPLNGQWQAVISLLAGYVITSLWPLWFLWAFLSIKNIRPTLFKIVCASVFFVASSSVILIFK